MTNSQQAELRRQLRVESEKWLKENDRHVALVGGELFNLRLSKELTKLRRVVVAGKVPRARALELLEKLPRVRRRTATHEKHLERVERALQSFLEH